MGCGGDAGSLPSISLSVCPSFHPAVHPFVRLSLSASRSTCAAWGELGGLGQRHGLAGQGWLTKRWGARFSLIFIDFRAVDWCEWWGLVRNSILLSPSSLSLLLLLLLLLMSARLPSGLTLGRKTIM